MVRCRLVQVIRMWLNYVTPCYVLHLQLYYSHLLQWLWYHRQCWCQFLWHIPCSLVLVCRCLFHGNYMYDVASRFLWCLAHSHQCSPYPKRVQNAYLSIINQWNVWCYACVCVRLWFLCRDKRDIGRNILINICVVVSLLKETNWLYFYLLEISIHYKPKGSSSKFKDSLDWISLKMIKTLNNKGFWKATVRPVFTKICI